MRDKTAFGCDCPHTVSREQDETTMMWRTIWRHGRSPESAMIVTDEMRDEWAEQGLSAVGDVMWPWVERVHEYERNDRAEAHKEEA